MTVDKQNNNTKKFDLIVFGATSFVGQIVCRHLWLRQLEGEPFHWALAGRSLQRLEALQEQLGLGAEALPLLIVDATDEGTLHTMVDSTKVVVSTVGPYMRYGSLLVRLCAEMGTDYCDLTGEVPWVAQMIEHYAVVAEKTGARIVHSCGFDSVPSDLGVQFLQECSVQQFKAPCDRVQLQVYRSKGGFSGGTVASMIEVARSAAKDVAVRRLLANPYALCPQPPVTKQPQLLLPEQDRFSAHWMAPFVMGGINTRVVHRSHALSHWVYGSEFKYDEVVLTGTGLRGRAVAWAMVGTIAAFMASAAFTPTRELLERFVLPKPGEGPSPQEQESGFYDLKLWGTTQAGQRLTVRVRGDRDPGYGSTGKILAEAALMLAFSINHQQVPGGFWTPATALGPAFRERLGQQAGVQFSLESLDTDK